ncbi:MAG: radical SAM protein [Clostridiales bacterium]|nr:MAG: radical SAM protein [Clostridiales bacterium]
MSHSNIAIFIPHKGCPHACSFCDQKSISGEQKQVTPLDVRRELAEAFRRPLDGKNTEIAFFGGSFTCIPRKEMEAFLEEAAPYVQQGKASGIRISTRPDGISEEILDVLKRYGVRSIELGAQSLDDSVLRLNRRGHTTAQVEKASSLIREYGFSLGLQMMAGLYGDRKESLYETAEKIIALKPDTVRIYPTVVIEGTYLDELRRKGLYSPLPLQPAVELCAPLLWRFEQRGIRVIRMGLHASETLERRRTGGAYHPAFRELCESFLKRRQLEDKLRQFPAGSEILVRVPASELSKTIGQKKANIIWAEQMGYRLTVRSGQSVKKGELKAELLPSQTL